MGVFDIVGPVMVGPSSSHTAGAARLGKMASVILGEQPAKATIILYGSFARTYRGHGTDKALVGGLLRFMPDDLRLKESLNLAVQAGLEFNFVVSDQEEEHPNTAEFRLQGVSGKHVRVTGRSIGGGQIIVSKIDSFKVEVTGEYHTLITIHEDKPGIIAEVSRILSQQDINIAQMRVSRQFRGAEAMMVLETDHSISGDNVDSIRNIYGIRSAIAIQPL
ncbi:MAG: sdhB [Firmicutes bacterium]|nr:sdhB [Bacillota bacterium]